MYMQGRFDQLCDCGQIGPVFAHSKREHDKMMYTNVLAEEI